MIDSPPREWRTGRWFFSILAIFLAQVGLIFWFGERPGLRRPGLGPRPNLYVLAQPSQEFLRLLDPTLFALPHLEGFSGAAWLKSAEKTAPSFVWAAPTNWLEVSAASLGVTFRRFLRSTNETAWPVALKTEPELSFPDAPVLLQATQSFLRVQGDLGQTRLLSRIQLKSWPSSTLLTNTAVRVLVSPEGTPLSLLLAARSGSAEADNFALEQVRNARFLPKPGSSPEGALNNLGWLTLVFEWHTQLTQPTKPVPPAATPTTAP